MLTRRIVISALAVVGGGALSLSPANAQYYPPCSFPLEWPFCVAGAAVNTAAAIATAPFTGPYYYTYGPYYGSSYYAPAYYYYPRRHHRRRHHYQR